MKGTLGDLRGDILKVQKVLEGDLFSITPEERKSLISDSQSLIKKIDTIEEGFLTIGLLGGTGVGKSTLMNALAGKEIASASHLRPYTDDILIYRHIDAPVPSSLPISEIPWREFTHEEASIKGILLCDLPDFDSLVGAHRERVIQFLEYLDLLIWITSPEKYGDGRFYEFLRLVPRSKENFYFVLNKTDLLFEGKSGNEGLAEVATITGYFRQYLKDEGLIAPPLYVISSREVEEAKNLAHWNQFPNLRQEIFRQRNFKEIKEIKGANLESDYELLLSSLNTELSYLETIKSALKEILAIDEKVIKDGYRNLEKAIDIHFERNPDDFTRGMLEDLSSLVGPSYGFAAFMKEWQRFAGKDRTQEDSKKTSEKITALFERHQFWQEDIIFEHLLRRGFSSTVVDHLKNIIDTSSLRSDYHESFEGLLEDPPARFSLFSKYSFKSVQYGIYLILFFVVIFSLAGEGAWRNLLDAPGLKSILNFFLKIVSTLFSPTGIAALGSYLLLNIFAGYRFYRSFVRRFEKESRKSQELAKKAITLVWKRRLNLIEEARKEYDKKITSRIASISGLKRGNGTSSD
ncbi:MAG: 50S ribosome-binding GTPase [Deltaproteobacteria bacterium]|nr:50S ribosome-binding GTPase [Deltaproteobacteria bacterium]